MRMQREEIIDKIKSWLQTIVNESKDTSFERFLDPQLNLNDVVFKVTSKVTGTQLRREEQSEKVTLSYFISLLDGLDIVRISMYMKFKESDNIGFKLLLLPDKIRFVNLLKIPLLTLNVNYNWLPDLNDFDSLEISKDIFYDGFSKNSYFDSQSAVLHAYEIVDSKYMEFRNSIKQQKE